MNVIQRAELQQQLRDSVQEIRQAEIQTAARIAAIGKHLVAVEGVISVDVESRIVFADDVMHKIAGYTPPALQGRPLTDLLGETHRDAYLQILKDYVESGEMSRSWEGPLVFPLRCADGSERPMILRASQQEALGRHILLLQLRPIGTASEPT